MAFEACKEALILVRQARHVSPGRMQIVHQDNQFSIHSMTFSKHTQIAALIFHFCLAREVSLLTQQVKRNNLWKESYLCFENAVNNAVVVPESLLYKALKNS